MFSTSYFGVGLDRLVRLNLLLPSAINRLWSVRSQLQAVVTLLIQLLSLVVHMMYSIWFLET